MIPIYVAGASAEIDRCALFMSQAHALGFEVSHDWAAAMAGAGKPDDALEVLEQHEHAKRDVEGIEGAELVIVLVPQRGVRTRGMLIEFGIALGLDRPILVVGDRRELGLFGTLATEYVADDAQALLWLSGYLAGADPEEWREL